MSERTEQETQRVRQEAEIIALDAIHRMNDQEPTELEYRGELRLYGTPADVLLALEHSTVLRCIIDALDDAAYDGAITFTPEAP